MNYEQKAKAYDEALAKARDVYQKTNVVQKGLLENLFPELAGSEEEKVRKELKRAIAVALDYSFFDKETADNCLAWLEKQGKHGLDEIKSADHIWKPADGEDLPEYDREVIVFCQPKSLKKGDFLLAYAHRPNPEGWSGKSISAGIADISTGGLEHFTPQTYDNGWSIPDVVWWLDLDFPKSLKDKTFNENLDISRKG